jgi:hypothetical protein
VPFVGLLQPGRVKASLGCEAQDYPDHENPPPVWVATCSSLVFQIYTNPFLVVRVPFLQGNKIPWSLSYLHLLKIIFHKAVQKVRGNGVRLMRVQRKAQRHKSISKRVDSQGENSLSNITHLIDFRMECGILKEGS